MKASILPFAILALVVGVSLLSIFVFNVIHGQTTEKKIYEMKIVDIAHDVTKAIQAYSILATDYSSQQVFRESACLGGLIGEYQWNWICGGKPSIPLVENVKECAEKFTRYYLNVYFEKYSIELPLLIYKKNFTQCNIGVDEEGVYSGKFDEGDFWVNCSGAVVSLKTKKGELVFSEDINTSYFLVNNRFWYLFRKIAEWARENFYSKCICGATMRCGKCPEVKACAREALRRLQAKFKGDPYVKCEWVEIAECCHYEQGPPCGEPRKCIGWCRKCCRICEPPCADEPPPKDICIPENLEYFSPFSSESEKRIKDGFVFFSPEESPEGYCVIWYEWRLEGADTFVCKDYKYTIPSHKGPIPLVFTIHAQAGFRVPHPDCEMKVPCPGPGCWCNCPEENEES